MICHATYLPKKPRSLLNVGGAHLRHVVVNVCNCVVDYAVIDCTCCIRLCMNAYFTVNDIPLRVPNVPHVGTN